MTLKRSTIFIGAEGIVLLLLIVIANICSNDNHYRNTDHETVPINININGDSSEIRTITLAYSDPSLQDRIQDSDNNYLRYRLREFICNINIEVDSEATDYYIISLHDPNLGISATAIDGTLSIMVDVNESCLKDKHYDEDYLGGALNINLPATANIDEIRMDIIADNRVKLKGIENESILLHLPCSDLLLEECSLNYFIVNTSTSPLLSTANISLMNTRIGTLTPSYGVHRMQISQPVESRQEDQSKVDCIDWVNPEGPRYLDAMELTNPVKLILSRNINVAFNDRAQVNFVNQAENHER